MESVVDRVEALQPVRFTWKTDMGNSNLEGKEDFGLIAQDVQAVFPEIVESIQPLMGPDSTAADPTLVVKYERMTVYLLKALQESMQKVKDLE